jgi:hypothetical protein
MYKIAGIILTTTLLFSCSNHYHDGTYRANVFGSNYLDIYREDLTIDGGELTDIKRSVYDLNTISSISKVSCTQFDDRIEYEDNGYTKVIPVTSDSTLTINAYTFKKIDQ